ncbi:MAG TPA: dihydroneopterin aldolase [Syntrophomonadaceae bacterium]|nr:dihydroneopterin aldolase [Syntrophomonadaceae bacterium]
MDKIIAKGLVFIACHGVLADEKRLPQKFMVDLELHKDLKKAGKTDDLSYTVNYDEVYHDVKDLIMENSYNLIEALAEHIAIKLLNKYPITAIQVTVYKPNAPIKGKFEYFAVNIYREKNEY